MDNTRIRTFLALGTGGGALVAGAACVFLAWKSGSVALGLCGAALQQDDAGRQLADTDVGGNG